MPDKNKSDNPMVEMIGEPAYYEMIAASAIEVSQLALEEARILRGENRIPRMSAKSGDLTPERLKRILNDRLQQLYSILLTETAFLPDWEACKTHATKLVQAHHLNDPDLDPMSKVLLKSIMDIFKKRFDTQVNTSTDSSEDLHINDTYEGTVKLDPKFNQTNKARIDYDEIHSKHDDAYWRKLFGIPDPDDKN